MKSNRESAIKYLDQVIYEIQEYKRELSTLSSEEAMCYNSENSYYPKQINFIMNLANYHINQIDIEAD